MRPLLALAVVLVATAAHAQPAVGHVAIRTNAPDAALYADGRPLGTAGAGPFAVEAGPLRLVLREDAPERWGAREAALDVAVAPGETLAVVLNLPVRYRVESLPAGATVAVEGPGGAREVLGTTPLVLDRAAALRGRLAVERAGFAAVAVEPGDSLLNRHLVLLAPLDGRADAPVDYRARRRARAWIDFAALGLAAASGIVAVSYKFRADDVDDRYRLDTSDEQGNPALKAEAERLDSYSAVALGLSTASLGLFAIRLTLR